MLWQGNSQPLWWAVNKIFGLGYSILGAIYTLASFGLGLVSLLWNSMSAPTEARRKTRVIVWGTLLGVTPMLFLGMASGYTRRPIFEFPFWIWAPPVLATFLLPLSIAYAVVKHRVLEVPLLLKRSARYLLVQRGLVVLMLIIASAATLALAGYFSRRFPARAEIALLLGAVFGVALVWAGTEVHSRVRQRLDRAFFRSAYDARRILGDLAQKARSASTRRELALLLEDHLREALHPKSLAVYLEVGEGRLRAECGDFPPEQETLATDGPAWVELARRGQPVELPPDQASGSAFASLPAECLLPITSRDGRLYGLAVLGPRLSEEPYSREDKRLLASIAAQAGVTLENLRLAEEMAVRLETERRVAHELEIARQVQNKLLPQKLPPLQTLEYAGACLQARSVGGDYYDFLDLGAGRLGFVLADIAGKGISAALLMANLQANLRSQYALALSDLPRLLCSVNRLFYENTEPAHYATFFFGVYDDTQRRLVYVNCGHNPPLLVRRDGPVERLSATATVLGTVRAVELFSCRGGSPAARHLCGLQRRRHRLDQPEGRRVRRRAADRSGARQPFSATFRYPLHHHGASARVQLRPPSR